MNLEIEKKYLVKKIPNLDNVSKIEYERYFISNDPKNQIRVQRKSDTYEIEKKIEIGINEYKKEKKKISKEEFFKLTSSCKDVIKRDSYLICENPTITIKIYHGKYEGLVRAEVEASSIKELESFKIPNLFGREITNSNIGMDAKLIKLSRDEFLKELLNENERIDDLELENLKIIQNKDYFCFGMDSILLANFVDSINSKNVIIDFCSGSGVIPVVISAKKKYRGIVAVELQDEMYELLSKNIMINGLSDKISSIQSDIKDIKYIKNIILEKYGRDNVDIIVCNPPYKKIGTGVQNENKVKYIARHEEMCTLEDVFLSSSKLLKSKGKLYLVHKPDRLVDLLEIARKYFLEPKKIRFVHPKLKSRASIVLIEYVKNGGSELIVDKPLIEYFDDGNYTEEIYSIYSKEEKNG